MSFAHPLAFALGLLAIPLVLLYRRKQFVPQRVVTTDWLWEKALGEERFRTAWQKYRTGASLALHLGVLALVTLAVAGPQIPSPRHLAIIIDNGVSMHAMHGADAAIDEAKNSARTMVASLRECDEAAIFSAAVQPSQRCGLTSDRAMLLAAIDGIAGSDGVPAFVWTLDAVRRMADARTAKVQSVIITDGCSGDAVQAAKTAEVDWQITGANAGHVALTRFSARRSPTDPQSCDFLIELHNYSDADVHGKLDISSMGKSLANVVVVMPANGRFEKLVTLPLPGGGQLTAAFEPDSAGTARPFDSTATIEIPPARVHRVRFVGIGQSSVKPILTADRRLTLVDAVSNDSETSNTASPTISVFDGRLPAKAPTGPLLIFNPTECDLWKLGKAIANPTVARVEESPSIFRGVHLRDAFLAEAHELQVSESIASKAKPLLWAESGQPLAYAIDRPSGRIVVISGDLAIGNLALQASFPQIVSQALDWLDGYGNRIGDKENAEWQGDDILYAPRTSQSVASGGIDHRTPATLKSNLGREITTPAPLPLALYPAGIALVLMVVEWCLYQRRWLC